MAVPIRDTRLNSWQSVRLRPQEIQRSPAARRKERHCRLQASSLTSTTMSRQLDNNPNHKDKFWRTKRQDGRDDVYRSSDQRGQREARTYRLAKSPMVLTNSMPIVTPRCAILQKPAICHGVGCTGPLQQARYDVQFDDTQNMREGADMRLTDHQFSGSIVETARWDSYLLLTSHQCAAISTCRRVRIKAISLQHVDRRPADRQDYPPSHTP